MKSLPEVEKGFLAEVEPRLKRVSDKETAKEFIVWHLQNFPREHETPSHLVNTYSAMGGHPIRYCSKCCGLVDKYKLKHIEGVKAGMYRAYYEPPSELMQPKKRVQSGKFKTRR